MSACWPIQIPPTPKAVLMSLADNANDHGVCWPSISTISIRTCFGKTAVIDAIKWLEDHGLLEADRSNGRHTKYQIKPNGMAPELFDATGNPSGSRTSPRGKPVRLPDQSARQTGTTDEPNPSASRTGPVRQADTNRQEPSGTKSEVLAPNGTRLPSDWTPTAEDIAFANFERPGLDVKAEADKFRDYWRSVAGAKGRKADWPATWRNWIRRTPQIAAPATASPPIPARDWRQPSESKLENEIAFIRQQYDTGALGDGPDAVEERDRRIVEVRRKYANETEVGEAA